MQPTQTASTPSPTPTPVNEPTPTPSYDDDKPGKVTVELPSSDLTLKEALDLFDSSKDYVKESYTKIWDQCFKVYKRQRVIRHYEGISDPVIPEAFTIIETLVANIAGGNVKFHFKKTAEEQTDDTDVLNGLLDYYLECNQMGLKNQEWVRDMLIYGTGILHVTWENGKPKIENVPLRDFFVDPSSTGLVSTRNPALYAGLVYLGDKDVMEAMNVYDPKEDKMVPMYKNLSKLKAQAPDADQKETDKQYKDQFQGSTLGEKASDKQIYVILMYDLKSGKLIEIGNRKQIIRQIDIPYQRDEDSRTVPKMVYDEEDTPQEIQQEQKIDAIKPFLPFAVLRDYIDTSLFYGEGEMAIIIDRQEMLNDLEAMDTDNLAYQNTPMYTIDPQFADLAPEIETIPGAVYPIPKGALQPMPIAEIAGNLDEKKDRVARQMRTATAADEAVQGVQVQQARVTATEVNSQLNQAQNRFSTKISNLENEGYNQLAAIIFKMIQIFVSQPTAVRIVGKQGVYFKDYDPWEFNGEWEPHAELDSTQKARQLEVGQKMNQMFEYMKENPTFDPVERDRFIMQHLDPTLSDEDFNAMLSKNPGLTPQQLEQAKEQLGKPATELVQFAYKDADDWGQMQIEKMFGMEPDPLHLYRWKKEAMMIGAQEADILNPHTQADGSPDPGVPPPPQPATPPAGMAQP